MSLLFIINPNSGHIRRRPALTGMIQDFIAKSGIKAEVVRTTHPGHATDIASTAAAEGWRVAVAVGGDGTVNEVGRALLRTPTALGVIPLGSGNGLARELGIPLSTRAALRNLLTGSPRRIDAGEANGQPFFCTAGTGFDAHVVQRFNQRSKRGFLAYLQEGVGAWNSYSPANYTVSVDGAPPLRTRALFLTAANASQFGNNARIAPAARIDDGVLDLAIVPPLTLLQAVPVLIRLFTGHLAGSGRVRFHRGARIDITSDRTGYFHVDGEVHPFAGELSLTTHPAALSVLTPTA